MNHIPTIRTVRELRAALEPTRRAPLSIGLVPTMGALHEGHLSLIRRAREECETVVVSVFVNPSQFEDRADLERYPRQEAHDAALAAEAGADIMFAPSIEEVYPQGSPPRCRCWASPIAWRAPRAGPSTSAASPPSSPSCSA